ncbi:DUF433 domain-containing protein [Gloeobacter violaceus]|uniref:DUF433 domain-containing protein n=1 Tax=Gloeobacter violaceus TaxID=33072 RepID=UPI0013E8EEF6|nr:DUF433 domain-containing protein [Gloeobacter violaceus]
MALLEQDQQIIRRTFTVSAVVVAFVSAVLVVALALFVTGSLSQVNWLIWAAAGVVTSVLLEWLLSGVAKWQYSTRARKLQKLQFQLKQLKLYASSTKEFALFISESILMFLIFTGIASFFLIQLSLVPKNGSNTIWHFLQACVYIGIFVFGMHRGLNALTTIRQIRNYSPSVASLRKEIKELGIATHPVDVASTSGEDVLLSAADSGSLIVKSADIKNGSARIAETGVTVKKIVSYYKLGLDPQEIVR